MTTGAEDPREGEGSPISADELRAQAEQLLAGFDQAETVPMTLDDMAAVVHELRVHQIELEMQNEELRRAQLELEDRQRKYFELFDRAPVGYITIDDQDIIADANQTAARMLGVMRKVLIGQPFSAFIFPADCDEYYVRHRALMYAGTPETFDLRLRRLRSHAEPGHFWAHVDSRPQFEDEGDASWWVTFADIDDRKRIEEALAGNEQRLREVAAQSGTVTWEVDAEGLYTYVSDVSEAVFGYPPGELVGRMHFYDLHPEDGREAFRESTLALFSQKASFTGLLNCVQAKGGGEAWVSTSGSALLYSDGTLRGYRGSDFDVTERKRAEEDLRLSEGSLVSILEATADGIMAVDSDGTMVFANRRFAELWMIPPEVMATKDDSVLLECVLGQLADPAGFLAKVEELYVSDAESRDTLYFNDGRVFDRVSLPLWDGDKPRGRVWSFRDVTERRHAAEELSRLNDSLEQRVDERTDELSRRTADLEQSLRVRDVFLASMSHELRTPLNSIIGFSSIVASGGAGELPPEAHKQIGFVVESSRQLLDVVDTLLDSAAIAAGVLHPAVAPFELAELLDTVETTMGSVVRAAGLEFAVLAPVEPVTMVSDRARIREVLFNLIGNAAKFTARGSVALEVTLRADSVRFAVSDTGIGIAAEDLKAIMDPFYQLNRAGIAKTQGAGLGLSICVKIAEALGGEITVESELGAGSTFALTLPSRAPDAGVAIDGGGDA